MDTTRKTILITGSTDGIGLETAKILATNGHHVLLHGRNPTKTRDVEQALAAEAGAGRIGSFVADLSSMAAVETLASDVTARQPTLDVLINNAGVYNAAQPRTAEGLDIRFAVNTIAPYLLTRRLAPLLGPSSRVINLSSAAQAPVDLKALAGRVGLSDHAAYAQSKLALTMWSRVSAEAFGDDGPVCIAVNPGSLLGTKMVRTAFGMAGGDIGIGAEILRRAALDDDFASASGRYYDNDARRFAPPHVDALDARKVRDVVRTIETILADLGHALPEPASS
ncbi:MAG: SDR family NAD(P)-dependent oxidoreductase [Acidobacteriota bacterium]